jgi:hypothetical protein
MIDKHLDITYDDLNTKGQFRAKRLMTKDFCWSPVKDSVPGQEPERERERRATTFRKEFEDFCENTAGGDAWVLVDGTNSPRVFFEESAFEAFLVIRHQRAGICYMHACVVLQHYVQCKRTGQSDHKMLDLSEFIRKHFNNVELTKFLQTGGGGNSLEFFGRITGIEVSEMRTYKFNKRMSQSVFQRTADSVLEEFNSTKEPALVSCFRVEKLITTQEAENFDYEVEQGKFLEYASRTGRNKPSLHSMVLIGAYSEEGKVWFLLQNCWKGQSFRLVTAKYLASCAATISFVPPDCDASLTESFDVIDAPFAETSVQTPEECAKREVVEMEG